jgi:hypothetical protein
VISYETIDGELSLSSASFDEIAAVALLRQGSLLSDTAFLVSLHDGSQFNVMVSTWNNGDRRFIVLLQRHLH